MPDFYYGFSVNLSWKGFDMAANFQGVYGNEILNLERRYLMSNSMSQNMTRDALQRFPYGEMNRPEPQADGQYRRLHLDFPRRGRLLPAPAEPLAGLHLPRQVDPQGRHLEAAHLRAGVEPLHVDRLFGLQSRSQQPRERRPASGRGLLFLSAGTHVQRRHQFQPLIDRNHEINILSFTGRRGPWDGFLQ